MSRASDSAVSTKRQFEAMTLAPPATVNKGRFQWDYAVGIWGIHTLALLAFLPWLFSWAGVIVMVVGVFFFGQGVNLGYHRLLTHRGLKVPRWYEYALVVVALCCLQDTPIKWATHHRVHHRFSDRQDDPHSPFVTFYWGHMGWLFYENRAIRTPAAYSTYTKDLLDDRFYRALERKWWLWNGIYLAHAGLFYAVGLLAGWATSGDIMEGVRLGFSLLVWGVFVRTVFVWHITWSVNSLSHVFGYRTHYTKEGSTNNWLVGLLAAGEGWHNNHHWDEKSARHGHRWWELDLTWMHVWLLERLGLAREVIRPRRRREKPTSEETA
jgi:stearoyl-CoA desaturase (delta-9 desaturase)